MKLPADDCISRDPSHVDEEPMRDGASVETRDPHSLTSLGHDLRELNAGCAKEFLALAGALQAISAKTRDITGVSRAITGLASNQDSDQAINILQHILAGAEQVEKLATTSHQRLQEILDHVEHSRSGLAHLLKLPPILGAVGALSRIEGSRLRSGSVDVSSLANDIGALALQIDKRVTATSAEADKLSALVMTSVSQLQRVGRSEHEEAARLIAQTRAVLNPLNARAEASRETARRIDEQYVGIRNTTDRIVMSLQSEDIARQRVEHIDEVLSKIAAAPEVAAEKDNVRLLALQRAQLAGTRDLLSRSIQSIEQALRDLTPRVDSLAGETSHLASRTGADGQSFSEAIGQGLDAVSSVLKRYAASAETLVQIVQTALSSVSAMTSNATELERVAFSIRRTALNARIETEHLGAEGAPMRALAAEVQGITDQSRTDSSAVLESLLAMDTTLKALSSECSASAGSFLTSSGLHDAETEISRLSESVGRSNHEMTARLTELVEGTRTLRSELDAACEVAVKATSVTEGFDRALRLLDAQLESLGYTPGTVFESAGSGDDTDLSQLYSMEDERRIHAQHFGSGSTAPSAEPVSQDLGDDVELF